MPSQWNRPHNRVTLTTQVAGPREEMTPMNKHHDGHWMAGAVKHPGALHRELGVPQGQKIPAAKVAAAAKKPGVEGQRARLAQTFAKMRGK